MGGQRKVHRENKVGGEMKSSVRIYLKKENCGSCGRWVVAKINIWTQKGKHNMPSTQPIEMMKRRNLLVLKTIKKTFSCCHTNAYRKSGCN